MMRLRSTRHMAFHLWFILWTFQSLSLGSLAEQWLGFKTEPHLIYESFNITKYPSDSQQLGPGYFFMDVLRGGEAWGPEIYDMFGTPIWLGPSEHRTQNLHVCDFEGNIGQHLCYSAKGEKLELPRLPSLPKGFRQGYGTNIILDNTYNLIRNFSHGFKHLPLNGHAFQMMHGGNSYLSPLIYPTIRDLRPYGGPKRGYVKNGCIQETDVRTKKSLFNWCYLESGLPMWESQTYFKSPRQHTNESSAHFGTGTKERPWDFLHFNSNDKTADGDYYVSFRHGNQIIKIAGLQNPNAAPGTVLWRLGGHSNDFNLEGFEHEIPFSRQHDVRALSINGSEEILSIFNNGWDGQLTKSQNYSEALFIKINTESWTASLERSYPHPQNKISISRGSTQALANSNVLVGWGILPEVSEFDHEGNLLYHAHFSQGLKDPEFSYRVYKFPWKAKPHWGPKLVAYCRQCASPFRVSNPVVAYASWNGATEIREWRFFTAAKAEGPWVSAGSFEKSGFETQAELTAFPHSSRSFRAYVRAEAIDESGAILGSTTTKTFVPKLRLRPLCNEKECKISRYNYNAADSLTWMCELQATYAAGGIFTFSLLIEALNFIIQNMILIRRFWL